MTGSRRITASRAPRRRRVTLLTAAALTWAAAASAQIGYTGSVYSVRFETADGARTDAVYVFTSIDFEHGRLRGAATVPVVMQQAAWIDPVLGPVETGWLSGIADPVLRLDGAVWRTPSGGASLRVSGSVKLPVASVEDGYSSGEVDVALGLSASIFRGRNSLLADFTYWWLGDPSEVEYRNVPAFYVGYARVLDRAYRWSAIASVSGAPSPVPGFDPAAQMSLAVLRVIGRGALGVSVDIGLTDSAANLAVGSTWRIVF